MGLLSSFNHEVAPANVGIALIASIFAAILSRIVYMQCLHPLSKFPGPWYATSFSIVGAIISIKKKEPEFFMHLVRKYGSKSFVLRFPLTPQFPQFMDPGASGYGELRPSYYCMWYNDIVEDRAIANRE